MIKFSPLKMKKIRKPAVIFLISLVIISLFFSLLPGMNPVMAKDDEKMTEEEEKSLIGRLLGWTLSPLDWLLGKLTTVVISLIIEVSQYNDFIGSIAVNKGWVIIRDLCNMLFIVMLLLIAFGTIFRIQNFHFRTTLPRLLAMAVLINFSKMICAFFIDFAQVVMLTFVNAYKDAGPANLFSASQMREMFTFSGSIMESIPDILEVVGTKILAVVMIIVFLATTLNLLIMLVMRIVALWVLIILSPLAYFFNILPATQNLAKQWWGQFFRYLIVGPVLAFFLWLTLSIVAELAYQGEGVGAEFGKIETESGFVNEKLTDKYQLAAAISEASTSKNILGFVAVVGLLIAASQLAKTSGIAGGDMVQRAVGGLQKNAGKMLGKMTHAATGPLRKGGSALKRFAARRPGLGWMTPKFWGAMGAESRRLTEQADEILESRGKQVAAKLPWRSKGAREEYILADRARRLKEKSRMREELGEAGAESRQQQQALGLRVYDTRDFEGEDRRRSFIELTGEQGNFDDVWTAFMREKITDDEEGDKKAQEMGFKDRHDAWQYHPRNIQKFARAFLQLDKKYDPYCQIDDIFEQRAKDEGLTSPKEIETRVEDLWGVYDGRKEGSEEEVKFIDGAVDQAQKRAKNAALKANEKDQLRLHSLADFSMYVRKHHWEQVAALIDPESQKSYMAGPEELGEEIHGEFPKRSMRIILANLVPHLFRALRYDPGKKEMVIDTDPNLMTREIKAFLALITKAWEGDFHHAPPRVSGQVIGVQGWVPDNQAIFNEENGKFISEEGLRRWKEFVKIAGKDRASNFYKHFFYGKATDKRKAPIEIDKLDKIEAWAGAEKKKEDKGEAEEE